MENPKDSHVILLILKGHLREVVGPTTYGMFSLIVYRTLQIVRALLIWESLSSRTLLSCPHILAVKLCGTAIPSVGTDGRLRLDTDNQLTAKNIE
jgi:hypothetical protein